MRKLNARSCSIRFADLGDTLGGEALTAVVGGQAPAYSYDPQKRAADVATQLQNINGASRNSPYSSKIFGGFESGGRHVPGMFDLYAGRAPNDGHGAFTEIHVPAGSTVTRIGAVSMDGETRVRIDLPGTVIEPGNHNASALIPGQQLLPTSTWTVEHPFVVKEVATTNPLQTKGGEPIHGTGGALEAKLNIPELMNNADAAGHVSLRLNDPVREGNPDRSNFGEFERGLAEKGLVTVPEAAHAATPVDVAHAATPVDVAHAATPVEVTPHAATPVEVVEQHPGAPVESAPHAAMPVEVVEQHAGAPVESAPHAATPVEVVEQHAGAPVESAPHAVTPVETEASHGLAAEPAHSAPTSFAGNTGSAFVEGLKGALDPTLGLRSLPSTVMELARPGATLESFHANGGTSGLTGRVVGGGAAALLISEVGGAAAHYVDNHLDGWVDKGTAQVVRDVGATAGTFLTESAPVAAWTSWALQKAGVSKEWADRAGVVTDVGARFVPIAGQAYTVGATAYGLYKAAETGKERWDAHTASPATDPFKGPATMVDLTNSVVTTTPPPAAPEPEAAAPVVAPEGTGVPAPAPETPASPPTAETPEPAAMVASHDPAPAAEPVGVVATHDPVPAAEPAPIAATYDPVPTYDPAPVYEPTYDPAPVYEPAYEPAPVYAATYEPAPVYDPAPIVAYDPAPSYEPDYSGGGYSDFGGGGFSDGGGYYA
jgi:hypothetical protein